MTLTREERRALREAKGLLEMGASMVDAQTVDRLVAAIERLCPEQRFRAELLMQPEDDYLLHVYELWCSYYEETEAYDRSVCTGPVHRGAIHPATPEQGRLIREHAQALFTEVAAYAHRYVELGLVRAKDLIHARHQARDRIRR